MRQASSAAPWAKKGVDSPTSEEREGLGANLSLLSLPPEQIQERARTEGLSCVRVGMGGQWTAKLPLGL